MNQDYIWEADYGDRSKTIDATKKLLETQNIDSLQCVSYFVNNNPYYLEFYVVVSYNVPKDNDIKYMKTLFENIGLKYRNDITMNMLFREMKNRRFNSKAFGNADYVNADDPVLFLFQERGVLQKMGYQMYPFTRSKEIFISHSSGNKPKVRQLIPYLNGNNHSVWFDEYSIKVGESLMDKINEGMLRSDTIIFWVTKEFISSNYCINEVDIALENNLKVINLVENDIEELPQNINDYKYIRISNDEPIEHIARIIFDIID